MVWTNLDLVVLGVKEDQPTLFYTNHFEEPFLKSTKAYYKEMSLKFIEENPVDLYLKKVQEALLSEDNIALQYLHESTRIKVVKIEFIEKEILVLIFSFS